MMSRVVLCFCLFIFFGSYADSPPQFEHFTINDGLSNNSVRRIIQDKKGFLWFGTLNGLNRFDGTQFRVFKSEPGNLNSLSNNRIHMLMEDSLEYMWLGTFDNKIHRFDPRTETFLNIDRVMGAKTNAIVGPRTMVEGSEGVIWIITENDGIIRFTGSENPDNYTIHIFNTSNLLPSNTVRFIHRDQKGTTWIGTEKGLLALPSDTFRTVPTHRTYFEKAPQVSFTTICETEKGLWLGTEKHGLIRYSFAHQSLKRWNEALDLEVPVTSLERGTREDVLVTTGGYGVLHIQNGGNTFTHYPPDGKNTSTPAQADHTYTDVYADRSGLFWLVTDTYRGVTLFDPAAKKFRYYDLNAKYRESLGDDEKHVFFEDSNNDLWLGLYGGGLCRFDHTTQTFDQYFHNPVNPGSLSSNLVLSIYEDHSKNLWVGTFQGGLNKLSLFNSTFTHIKPNPRARFRLENEVRSVLEDRFGHLWVGTKAGKVYGYDQNNTHIFTLPDDLPSPYRYRISSVYSLLEDRQGDLWIGTKGEGLFRIEGLLSSASLQGKDFKIHLYKNDPDDQESLSSNSVYALLQDHYGQIWAGTYNGGLDLVQNTSGKVTFRHFKNESEDTTSLSDDRIRCLLLDKQHNLWIGTSNGLNILKAEYLRNPKNNFVRFMRDPSEDASLSNNDIIYLHQDQQGHIWAGTYGGGLNQCILPQDGRENAQFKHFTKKDGLPSDVIFSILEDNSGHLWVGTDNGLCKFYPNEQQIENYLSEDGLGENTFSEGVCVKAASGELIFGHLNGFVRFSPDKIRKNPQSFPLVFTDFNIFNERVKPGAPASPLSSSIETTRELTLPYNQNFIGIEFAVLDYKAPEKIQYSFMLENFEEQWNYVVGQNQAVYRGLRPGEYIFKVKGANSDGVWIDEPKMLNIHILPPIWKTPWAYMIYVLLLVVAIWAITYFVMHEIKLQNEITLGKRLTENKLKFYTNISHEFKTPLTLITGPAEDLLNDPALPSLFRDKVEVIKRNSTRLLNLIEQLLDFRRIQSGKMELKTQYIELYTFFNDIYLSFLPLAGKKQIRFVFKPNFKEQMGWIDPKHVEKIMMNLLSNAFKHTPAGKKICFALEVDDRGKTLKIKVKDQGEGISKENLDKIFDRFTFVKNDFHAEDGGSGIGLSLTRDLVLLHKGTIHVESTPARGSKFMVTIPIDDQDYTEKEKHTATLLDHILLPHTVNGEMEAIATAEEEFMNEKLPISAIKSRILVIEDNPDLCTYLSEEFRKYYGVAIAPDGAKGLEKAIQIMPDLIICDIMMPGMSGLEVTRQLKQNINTSHIPIVLLTARATLDQKIEGIETGADDYITKPFNLPYLKIRVEKIIEQRKKLKDKFSSEPGLQVSGLGGTSADQQFLNKVIALVEEKMSDPVFNIEHLVKDLGYSRTFFYKKLKGISGYTPNEFVRTIRMKKAALMLKSGDYTVAETSYDVGISDPNYFSKCFKNHFGESPSEFGRKHKAIT